MLARSRDQGPVATPHRQPEDELGILETGIANGSAVHGKLLGPGSLGAGPGGAPHA